MTQTHASRDPRGARRSPLHGERGPLSPHDRFLINQHGAAELCSLKSGKFLQLVNDGHAPRPALVVAGNPLLWSVEELRAWARSLCPPMSEWSFTGSRAA